MKIGLIDVDGLLIVKYCPNDNEPTCMEVPRLGMYIIQLGDGKMYKW